MKEDVFFKQKTSAIFCHAHSRISREDIAAALYLHVDVSRLTYSEKL